MSAYLVFTRDKTVDQQEMDVYAKEASATLAGHPAKPLAFYGAHQDLEGPSTEGIVIIEFPQLSTTPRLGTTAHLIVRRANIASRARPIASHSFRESEQGKASGLALLRRGDHRDEICGIKPLFTDKRGRNRPKAPRRHGPTHTITLGTARRYPRQVDARILFAARLRWCPPHL